jgi:secreted PhoX family phosphatase
VPRGALSFKPIPPNTLDTVIVPNGYDHAVILRWGDKVLPKARVSTFSSNPRTRKACSSATTTTGW